MGKMVEFAGSTWDGSGLVTSKNQNGKVFLMGCVEYPRIDGKGTSTVVFTSQQAFFFYDEDDDVLWSPAEMKNGYTSKQFGGDFPESFDDSYKPILTAGYDSEDKEDYIGEANMETLEKFGLGAEAAEDIKARMKALAPFRIEKDIVNG